MLDILFIKNNLSETINSLKKKKFDGEKILEKLIFLDTERIRKQKKTNTIQEKININSKKIGELYKKGGIKEAQELKLIGSKLKEELKKIIDQEKNIKEQIHNLIITIPNIPHSDVPKGNSEENNKIEKTSNIQNIENENHLNHWDLAKKYDLIDFEKGTIITGAGFPLYKEKGAVLQRALINLFLEFNTKAGYTEYIPPLLVNEQSAFGTGNFPDKEGQMYHIEKDNLYLIPTAEIPLTNIYRNSIIESSDLPIKMTGYTPCFRREAGSYGKNVRGLNRLHLFDKVEIVQITHPEKSYDQLKEMVNHVESLLNKLELPFRIVKLCGGDLSFSSALTYDFEVFSSAQKKWLEVSSVSNFETFQSRRTMIRFKENKQTRFCHTLNGSALAIPRILAAILENNQNKNGIKLPKELIKYTGFETI